jgi:hypothetical protein
VAETGGLQVQGQLRGWGRTKGEKEREGGREKKGGRKREQNEERKRKKEREAKGDPCILDGCVSDRMTQNLGVVSENVMLVLFIHSVSAWFLACGSC